jgi:concentrative nucleoside transporter, CNT family
MFLTVTRGLLGICGLLFIAWLISSNRRRFPWKTVIVGIGLQWALAFIVLRTDPGRAFFDGIGTIITTILYAAEQGAKFVFGPLAGNDPAVSWKGIPGITIMVTIITVATLSAIGYHYGILQRVVAGLAWVMTKTMNLSGAESLSGAANVFLGQTEAPLLVKPYIRGMTRSELTSLMTCGFATVAAGIMAYYVTLLRSDDPRSGVAIARHLMTASLMSSPAGFVLSKVMVPETETPETLGGARVTVERDTTGLLDAATRGASEGMRLAINVAAMLIAFIALITLVDAGLIALGKLSFMAPVVHAMGLQQLDLDGILGLIFSPVAWLLGVDRADCRVYGGLLGKAMATNEVIAYGSLGEIIKNSSMSERSTIMAIYSLCGFANFSSIGIQIGGIGSLAPERRSDFVSLGPRAMLGGAMASWMTGCIAGVLLQG